MKGVIFTEFLEMVDQRFGWKTTERMIATAAPASKGSYTAAGSYPARELTLLVEALNGSTDISVHELGYQLGLRLFERWRVVFPSAAADVVDGYSYALAMERHFGGEPGRFHPESEWPIVTVRRDGREGIEVIYRNTWGLAGIFHGILEGGIRHFDKGLEIKLEDLSTPAGAHVIYTLERPSEAMEPG